MVDAMRRTQASWLHSAFVLEAGLAADYVSESFPCCVMLAGTG